MSMYTFICVRVSLSVSLCLSLSLYIYVSVYGGALNITISIVGNGIGDQSLNPRLGCLRFTSG